RQTSRQARGAYNPSHKPDVRRTADHWVVQLRADRGSSRWIEKYRKDKSLAWQSIPIVDTSRLEARVAEGRSAPGKPGVGSTPEGSGANGAHLPGTRLCCSCLDPWASRRQFTLGSPHSFHFGRGMNPHHKSSMVD